MKTYYLLLIAAVLLCGCKDEITDTSNVNNGAWVKSSEVFVSRLIMCQNGYIIGINGSEALISKDNGSYWKSVGFPYNIQSLCSGTNDELYTASSNNLLLSTSYGTMWDWKPVSFDNEMGGVTYPDILCSAVSPDNVLYIGTSYGLLCSGDKGNTWKRFVNGIRNLKIVSLLISKNGTIFAESVDEESVLYMSSDKGDSWQKTTVTGQTITALAEDSTGTIYAGGLFKLYKSSDNGLSWSSDLAPGTKFTSIFCDKNNRVFTSFDEGGLYMSTDKGTTWTDKTPDSSATKMPVFNVAISRHGYLIASTAKGLYKSKDSEYK